MADTAVEGVILRILAGERPQGFKNTAYWPGVGVMEFLRKRVRRHCGDPVGMATLLISALCLPACSQPEPPADENMPCAPPDTTQPAVAEPTVMSGRYRLSMTATEGRLASTHAEGSLWLVNSKVDDSSPHDGEVVASVAVSKPPLIGATDLPFAQLGLEQLTASPRFGPPTFWRPWQDDTLEALAIARDTMMRFYLGPPATSLDPVYPGVLVESEGREGERSWQITLLIGTVGNDRTERGRSMLDGGGIGLRVVDAVPNGFRGTWGPWGLTQTGSGYFCAIQVGAV